MTRVSLSAWGFATIRHKNSIESVSPSRLSIQRPYAEPRIARRTRRKSCQVESRWLSPPPFAKSIRKSRSVAGPAGSGGPPQREGGCSHHQVQSAVPATRRRPSRRRSVPARRSPPYARLDLPAGRFSEVFTDEAIDAARHFGLRAGVGVELEDRHGRERQRDMQRTGRRSTKFRENQPSDPKTPTVSRPDTSRALGADAISRTGRPVRQASPDTPRRGIQQKDAEKTGSRVRLA